MYNSEVIMKTLFKLLLLMTSLIFTGIIFTSAAFADPTLYTQAGFDKLQKEGKSILVEVHAPWCPTCRAQAPIVNELLKKKEY
jgi:thioredoxin 1